MKWTTRFLFLLAISLAAGVVAMVSTQRNRTPKATLDSVEAALSHDDYNQDTLLRALDIALKDSRDKGDRALTIRALTLRGDLLLNLGAAEAARKDFQEIRGLLDTPDEALLLRLVEADILAGDPDSGLRRIDELLSAYSGSAKAWVQRGRLYQASATLRTDRCNELASEALAHDNVVLASTLIDRLATQDLLDPRRAGSVSALRRLFTEADGERISRILVLSDEASVYSRDARSSLETSFQHGIELEGVYEYITLLMRADQPEKAMRFGAQVRDRIDVASHLPTSLQLMLAHMSAGDADGAGGLAADLIQADRDLTTSEYGDCCRALLAAERWFDLSRAATNIRRIGTSVDSTEAALYLGMAQKGRKRYSNARTLLRSFASSNIAEPYPGARYEAWAALAELDRAAEEVFFERESIHAALQLDSDGPGSWRLWKRLAELQLDSAHSGLLLPLHSYAQALCRRPKQYDEVIALFEEIGATAVNNEGRDLELIYQDLVRERRSLPPIPLDAYSLLTIARRHAKDGNHLAVISVCRRLLDNLPGFVLATDLMIDARLKLGRTRSATEQIVDRIDTIGLDKTSREFVRRLPPDPYSTAQLHRVMRADPAWTGRLEIARRMRAEGDFRGAVKGLEAALGGDTMSSEVALLSAQLYSELGQGQKALAQLKQVSPSDPSYTEALLLSVRLASLMDDKDSIDEAAAALIATEDQDSIRELAKVLIFDRRLDKVEPVLQAIEGISGDKDPWHLEHSILYHVVRGETKKAREAAATAEAFTSSSLPPLGLVIASTIAVDPRRLTSESFFILSHHPEVPTPIAEAVLRLFVGHKEQVRLLLERAYEQEQHEPEWILVAVGAKALGVELGEHPWSEDELAQAHQLIHGNPDAPREPYTSLGVLLASQTHFYAPYALEKLNQYAGSERTAWDAYLIAKTLRTGGERQRARDALWSWVQPGVEHFAPTWDLFEGLEQARLGTFDHPEFDALRVARIRSSARSNPQGMEVNIARAYAALAKGTLKVASAAAMKAYESDPSDHAVNACLARIETAMGNDPKALDYWLAACEDAPKTHLRRYVTGALDSVQHTFSSSTHIAPSIPSGVLESLSVISSNDPRIPLALAHLDLLQNPDNPSMGVARAFRRLDNFLVRDDKVGLADRHPGTELQWLDFYLQYDPEQALEFCRAQLTLSPGVFSLWLGEIRAMRSLGRYEDALRSATNVLQMGATAELYEEIAACLQATGATAKKVEAQLAKANKLRGGELSVDGMLTRTKSLLDVKGEGAAGQAIDVLERVWNRDSKGSLSPMDSEVGLLLAEGYMKRGKGRDKQKAERLLRLVADRGQNPYDRSLSKALAGICSLQTP